MYCLVTVICGQRDGTIFVVTYDTLEWTVAATQLVGHVGFIARVHHSGATSSLSYMVSSHSHYGESQSTLMVVVSAQLNGSMIGNAGGGIQQLQPSVLQVNIQYYIIIGSHHYIHSLHNSQTFHNNSASDLVTLHNDWDAPIR